MSNKCRHRGEHNMCRLHKFIPCDEDEGCPDVARVYTEEDMNKFISGVMRRILSDIGSHEVIRMKWNRILGEIKEGL